LSPLGSLVELKGPFSYFLPEFELKAWVDCLNAVVASSVNKEMAARDGAKWASAYSWTVSAAKHLEVFDAVAAGR